jgi:hypothetical protein
MVDIISIKINLKYDYILSIKRTFTSVISFILKLGLKLQKKLNANTALSINISLKTYIIRSLWQRTQKRRHKRTGILN